MASAAVTQGRGLLTALAGLTAYEVGDYDEVMAVARDPRACAAALVLASKLAEALDRAAGQGSAAALRSRLYDEASALAYSR